MGASPRWYTLTKAQHFQAATGTIPPYERLHPMTCLHQLQPGDRATILHVGGTTAMRRRLAEMGMLRGQQVTVKRAAPLGDPMAYEVKGYHLSLRNEDAARIEVERELPNE